MVAVRLVQNTSALIYNTTTPSFPNCVAPLFVARWRPLEETEQILECVGLLEFREGKLLFATGMGPNIFSSARPKTIVSYKLD
jgi:hypothetical protein